MAKRQKAWKNNPDPEIRWVTDRKIPIDLQNVGDDANAPHVGCEWQGLVVDNLRTDKFRCSQHFPDLLARFDFSAQPEINQFEQVPVLIFQHDVFRFQIQMSNIFAVHVFQAQKDLLDEIRGFFFGKTLFFGNEVKKLTTS